MIIDDLIMDLPEQFKDKKRIHSLLNAFARQMEEVSAVMHQLETMRSMNSATGKQLDYCGDIVALSRAESALYCSDVNFDVIDDERYRLFVKYKAMRNSTQCTYDQMIAGCRLLFDADPIYYREDDEHPASFALTLGVTNLSEDLLALISTSDLSIRASGVQPRITCFAREFFGFSDTNRYALGFGVGKFAVGIQEAEKEGLHG